MCLDGSPLSEAILPFVETWAARLHLDVALVHVVDPARHPEPHTHAATAAEARNLERIAQDLEPSCGPVSTEVLVSPHPATAIADFASTRPGVLLALATHGRSGLERVTMGSIAIEVVRHSTTPVLTVRPSGLLQN